MLSYKNFFAINGNSFQRKHGLIAIPFLLSIMVAVEIVFISE